MVNSVKKGLSLNIIINQMIRIDIKFTSLDTMKVAMITNFKCNYEETNQL